MPKTYVFDQPCTMSITVKANNIIEARKKVEATIYNRAVNIEQDLGQGYVVMGPDTGAPAELVDEYVDD